MNGKLKNLLSKLKNDKKFLIIVICILLLVTTVPSAIILSSKKSSDTPLATSVSPEPTLNSSTPEVSDKIIAPTPTNEMVTAGTTPVPGDNDLKNTPTPASTSKPAQPTPTTAQKPTDKPATYAYGNTSGNITNEATTGSDGTYIYYRNPSDGNKLYKIKPDGTSKSKVSDLSPSCINVLGDWVYYLSGFPNHAIYKVKKNGSGNTKITDSISFAFSVVNEWIYFSESGGDGNNDLYKIKTDGSSKTKINFGPSNSLVSIDPVNPTVVGDWIYMTLFNPSDKCSELFRVKTDGSAAEKVLNSGKRFYAISDGWIYYAGQKNELRKVKIDGSSDKLLFSLPNPECYIYSVNVSGGYVYLSTDSDKDAPQDIGMYKIKIDGTNYSKLLSGHCRFMSISLDWIYFEALGASQIEFSNGVTKVTIGDSSQLLKIKTDGSQLTEIN